MKQLNHLFLSYLLSLVIWGILGNVLYAAPPTPTPAPAPALPNIEAGQVVLPWPELKKLLDELDALKRAKSQEQDKQKVSLPVEYSITEALLKGEVKDSSVRFEASFAVQVLATGWSVIPFFPTEVGIEAINFAVSALPADPTTSAASESPQPAPKAPLAQFIRDTKGYSLIARGPQSFTVTVVFHAPLQVAETTYTLSFLPPRSVINHLLLHIPEKGVNLLQTPPHSQVSQKEEATTVETVLSEHDELKLSWKIEKDSGLSRKSLATQQTLVSVNKTDLTGVSAVVLKYVTSLEHIIFQLPLTVEILNVTSLNIDQWTTEKLAQFQTIKVMGKIDSRTPIKIDISYRLRLPTLPAEIAIPTIEILGVDNIEGFLGVEVLENLEVTAKEVKAGLLIPAKNLPKTLWQKAANPLLYGYQFFANNFAPALNIRSYQELPTVVANIDWIDCVTHRTLEGKSITRVIYFIRNNDRQFLTVKLPDNSRIWQAFLDGQPVKPAQKDSGEILIPMKKSAAQGEELQSFTIEVGYTTDVSKLSLKGDILNQLPTIDIPISYLRWGLYLPEYYEYSRFEGPLKQVTSFSLPAPPLKPQIDIPYQGQLFLFEKHLVVAEQPYVRSKYGQFLGDDIFLSFHPEEQDRQLGVRYPKTSKAPRDKAKATMDTETNSSDAAWSSQQEAPKQQVILNRK
jgi:hypothetical protein